MEPGIWEWEQRDTTSLVLSHKPWRRTWAPPAGSPALNLKPRDPGQRVAPYTGSAPRTTHMSSEERRTKPCSWKAVLLLPPTAHPLNASGGVQKDYANKRTESPAFLQNNPLKDSPMWTWMPCTWVLAQCPQSHWALRRTGTLLLPASGSFTDFHLWCDYYRTLGCLKPHPLISSRSVGQRFKLVVVPGGPSSLKVKCSPGCAFIRSLSVTKSIPDGCRDEVLSTVWLAIGTCFHFPRGSLSPPNQQRNHSGYSQSLPLSLFPRGSPVPL